MEKILTVSIAAYNAEKFIERTIESLLCEEIIDKIEILVCDDGGTDSTLDIVRKYSDKYPDSIKGVHKENGGYGSVINTNAKIAVGKYFKQLDGDDLFFTENLPTFIDLLSHIDSDCVYTAHIIRKPDDEKIEDTLDYIGEGEYRYKDTEFRRVTTMYGSTFKTEILQKMQINIAEHCFYTDVEYINLPLPKLETFYVTHIPIYIYNLGIEGQSMSVEGIRKHYKDHEKVFWKLVSIYNDMDDSEVSKKKLLMIRLKLEFANHLKYYCMLPKNKVTFKEMKEFAGAVKEKHPDIFDAACDYSRFAKLLIKTNYLSYPFMFMFIK